MSPRRRGTKDDAEICIFNTLLEPLIGDELIRKEDNKIVLTTLGYFSVREGTKRYSMKLNADI